eukprot:10569082-Lingulodinium_polyedra.AAC.1
MPPTGRPGLRRGVGRHGIGERRGLAGARAGPARRRAERCRALEASATVRQGMLSQAPSRSGTSTRVHPRLVAACAAAGRS